jgi:hypothetical protein
MNVEIFLCIQCIYFKILSDLTDSHRSLVKTYVHRIDFLTPAFHVVFLLKINFVSYDDELLRDVYTYTTANNINLRDLRF